MAIISRPWSGPADLATMQDLVSRSWLAHRPLVECTAGDLEWWLANDPDAARSETVRLWFDGVELVGWGWLEPPATLDWHLRGDLKGGPVHEALLDWLEDRASDAAAAGTSVDTTRVWGMDGDERTRDLLVRRGYRASSTTLRHWIHPLRALAAPALPDGYRLRHVRWPDDLAARVEVHRAAFHPSRMTVEKYGLLPGRRLYATERDWVVEAPDESFAAFALGWWDPMGRIGELEPVGTHPDHQRRGLGRAVCLAAIRSLAAAGAPEVLVFSDPSESGPDRLYESVGFEPVTVHRRYEQSRP